MNEEQKIDALGCSTGDLRNVLRKLRQDVDELKIKIDEMEDD